MKAFPGRGQPFLTRNKQGISGGSFRDNFDGYGTRIYTTDMSLRDLTTIDEIEAEIEEAEAGRRKPGNILFDNLGIEISASLER